MVVGRPLKSQRYLPLFEHTLPLGDLLMIKSVYGSFVLVKAHTGILSRQIKLFALAICSNVNLLSHIHISDLKTAGL